MICTNSGEMLTARASNLQLQQSLLQCLRIDCHKIRQGQPIAASLFVMSDA